MQNKNKNGLKYNLFSLKNKFASFYLGGPTIINAFVSALLIKVLLIGALFLFNEKSAIAASLITASQLTALTNQERVERGLDGLQTNDLLTDAAYRKATNVIERDYFAHTAPEGKPFYAWIREEGYAYKSAGENLAIFFTEGKDVIVAWMASQSHRDNILDPFYREIGIAVVTGDYQGKETTVVAQLFGEPISEGMSVVKEGYALGTRTSAQRNESMAPKWLIMVNYTTNTVLVLLVSAFLFTYLRHKRLRLHSIAQ